MSDDSKRFADLERRADEGDLPPEQESMVRRIVVLQAIQVARREALDIMLAAVESETDEELVGRLEVKLELSTVQAYAVVDMQLRGFTASRRKASGEELQALINIYDQQYQGT